VVTDKGKALILYSLKNAVAELDDMIGLLPHRSYWVNKTHVASFEKQGREGSMVLRNGQVIPVSRSKLNTVRQALSGSSN